MEFRFYDDKGMLNGEMYSIYYDKKNNKFKIEKTQYENNNFKGSKAITTKEDIEDFFQKFGNTNFSMKLNTVLCSKNNQKDLNLFNPGLFLAKHIEENFNYKKALQDCVVNSDKTETLQVNENGNRFRINFDDNEDKSEDRDEEKVFIGRKTNRAKQDLKESSKSQLVDDDDDKQKDETDNKKTETKALVKPQLIYDDDDKQKDETDNIKQKNEKPSIQNANMWSLFTTSKNIDNPSKLQNIHSFVNTLNKKQ